MSVIIFAGALMNGLFGVNGTSLVDKSKQTTVITIILQYAKIYNEWSHEDKVCLEISFRIYFSVCNVVLFYL